MDPTIADEIKSLEEDARRFEWQVNCPSACPRAAWDQQERLKAVLEKLADLKAKAAAATGSAS